MKFSIYQSLTLWEYSEFSSAVNMIKIIDESTILSKNKFTHNMWNIIIFYQKYSPNKIPIFPIKFKDKEWKPNGQIMRECWNEDSILAPMLNQGEWRKNHSVLSSRTHNRIVIQNNHSLKF